MEMTLLNIVSQSQKVTSGSINPISIMLGSALTAAVASGIINSIINNRKIKADVISKSRIEWIQDVRGATSDYLAEVSNYLILLAKINNLKYKLNVLKDKLEYTTMYDYYEDDDGLIEEYEQTILHPDYEKHNKIVKDEIIKTRKELEDIKIQSLDQMKIVIKTMHLLRLYFPSKSNKEKNEIHVKIKKRLNIISLLLNLFNKADVSDKSNKYLYRYINIEIKYFSELISDYLKEEWDKAKKNK